MPHWKTAISCFELSVVDLFKNYRSICYVNGWKYIKVIVYPNECPLGKKKTPCTNAGSPWLQLSDLLHEARSVHHVCIRYIALPSFERWFVCDCKTSSSTQRRSRCVVPPLGYITQRVLPHGPPPSCQMPSGPAVAPTKLLAWSTRAHPAVVSSIALSERRPRPPQSDLRPFLESRQALLGVLLER